MPSSPARKVVYIVDDDESVRKGLSRLLRSAGLDARAPQSIEQFVVDIARGDAACILLDITMPGTTGLQLQQRLIDLGIETPVVAISARDDEETRDLARELGARFFLRKPVDDQALLDAVDWVTRGAGTASHP